MRWDIIAAIKYRLEHPESIPGKSWWTVYRQDIQTLLQEIENEQRKAKSNQQRGP